MVHVGLELFGQMSLGTLRIRLNFHTMAPDLRVVSLMDLAQMLQIQRFEVIHWDPWNHDESWHVKQKIQFKLG